MSIGIDIYNKDIVLQNGKLSFISQKDKVSRDFKKMLLTDACLTDEETKEYRYNREYGLLINKRGLYKGLNSKAILDMVKILLASGISNYVKLQETRDNLSIGEIISNIDFYAFYNPDDKSSIIITITVYLATGETIELGTFEQTIA